MVAPEENGTYHLSLEQQAQLQRLADDYGLTVEQMSNKLIAEALAEHKRRESGQESG
jgi:hypothetical protein